MKVQDTQIVELGSNRFRVTLTLCAEDPEKNPTAELVMLQVNIEPKSDIPHT
jgi:hypothetical protein